MASVSISNVQKAYGATRVIHGVDVDINDGEFVVLVGPSGCGKSTLLRMIAGLETISGTVGSRVGLRIAPESVHLFDKDTGIRLVDRQVEPAH